jgi:hypothetical protein
MSIHSLWQYFSKNMFGGNFAPGFSIRVEKQCATFDMCWYKSIVCHYMYYLKKVCGHMELWLGAAAWLVQLNRNQALPKKQAGI